MSKTIILKLTLGGRRIGPFTITDDLGNIIATDVPKDDLINGKSYVVADSITNLTISSTGLCTGSKTININRAITPVEIANSNFTENNVSSLWRHLVPNEFNKYYGGIFPYVIETPFAYGFQDQITQSFKDYTKVFQYLPNGNGVFNNYEKIEVNDVYFNRAILYNGQQNSGILELVPKPKHNLNQYNQYPIYRVSSKVVLFTKSDNFYNFNNFYNVVKNNSLPQFTTDCNSLSVDKTIDNSNMDYSKRSFKKEPLRAKDLKVRLYYDNSTHHLVSQMSFNSTQLSYK